MIKIPAETATIGIKIAHTKPMTACVYRTLISLKVSIHKRPRYSKISLSDELLPMADVIVAMYSTNLVHACYLRLPGISIMLPDAGQKRMQAINMADFPPNQVGATIGIYEPELAKLVKTLERVKTNLKFVSEIRATQEKYFPLAKESAAEKVYKTLAELIGQLVN